MPKITIRERDLTSAGNLEATTNAVYIPGYSVMGPTNQPTLCETLEDFQRIFGSTPYKFRAIQQWPKANDDATAVVLANSTKAGFDNVAWKSTMGNFYEKGELEKSYIMAAELLRLGLPVLYERVFDKGLAVTEGGTADGAFLYYKNEYAWTATGSLYEAGVAPATGETDARVSIGGTATAPIFKAKSNTAIATISATTPGKVSDNIYYTIVKTKVSLADEETGIYYTISVGRTADVEMGTGALDPVTTAFTFDSAVAAEYSSVKMFYPNQTLEDNSGLIKIKFGSTVNADMLIAENEIDSVTQEQRRMPLALPWDEEDRSSNGVSEDEFTVNGLYKYLSTSGTDADTGEVLGLDRFTDKGEYVIKFITSGAYPVFEFNGSVIAKAMVELAANRGDCTALIDHTPNNERTLFAIGANSVYAKATSWARTPVVNKLGEDAYTYAAMFTPYGVYNCSSVNKQVMLPASHGYLSALAASVQVNGNWMAAAGVNRGGVPNLISLCQNLTNAIADSYQNRDGISINPITNIKPYGLTIWGNRTLKNNAKKGDLTATSFLSIRQLTNDVKRTVWVAAKTLTFEQNSDILWINFKSKIMPTLDQMVSGSGITKYEIKKQATTKKATVKAVVRLYAIEPVEDWDITIELADSYTDIAG